MTYLATNATLDAKIAQLAQTLLSVKDTFSMMEHNFTQLCKRFIMLRSTGKYVSWKSKGILAEKFITPTTANNSLFPLIKWYTNSNFCLVFRGSCLKQKSESYTPPNIYEFGTWWRDFNSYFTSTDSLLGVLN